MLQTNLVPGSKGTLRLPRQLLGLYPALEVSGGPYRFRPPTMLGVCLLEHGTHDGGCDVWLPIPDFGVPKLAREHVGSLVQEVFRNLLRGRKVYVGCTGGQGRTGLFLALLAKAWGIADPVEYVRRCYVRQAVETREQAQWVDDFDVSAVRRWLLVETLTCAVARLFRRR